VGVGRPAPTLGKDAMATTQPPKTSTKNPMTGKGQAPIIPNTLPGGKIHINPKTGK